MFINDVEALQLHNGRAAELRAQAAEYRLARSVAGRGRHRRRRKRQEAAYDRPALP